MKALRIIAGLLVLLAVLAAIGVTWVVTSRAGARWAVPLMAKRVNASLTIGGVNGTLAGPLTLTEVKYVVPGDKAEVKIERVELDLALKQLFARTLQVERARVVGAVVTLQEVERQVPSPAVIPLPPVGVSLPDPPLAVAVAGFTLENGRVRRGTKELLVVDRAVLAGNWTRAGVALERFDLDSPQGRVEFAGRAAGGPANAVSATGRFRWELGGNQYAGELRGETVAGRPHFIVELRAPFRADLRATLPAKGARDWRVSLDAPDFDPRGRLRPADGVLTNLGAQLEVAGTVERATASGEIRINGETVNLEKLEMSVAHRSWRVESLVARINGSEGTLRAEGDLPVAGTQGAVEFVLRWDELAIPESWTGRPLRTRGDLRVAGRAEDYSMTGNLGLGPPGQIAELAFELSGDRESMRLERGQLNQPGGQLSARGMITFRPALRWDLSAEAGGFNPGEFFPAWSGRLDGNIATAGTIAGPDPRITVTIDRLNGMLRDRPIAGRADLVLAGERSIAGYLHLESGQTRLEVKSLGGDQPEATVSLAVEALEDWLPKAAGALQADFRVKGDWPRLAIEGTARGRQLVFRDLHAEAIELSANVTDLQALAGKIEFTAGKVTGAGRRISGMELRASGDASAHQVSLGASAQNLETRLQLNGGLEGDRWTGRLEQFSLAWPEILDLKLVGPARLAAARDGSFEIGALDLVDGDIRIHLDGGRNPNGRIHAGFALHEIPLALAGLIAPKALPVAVEGHLSGEGRIRQDDAGRWQGSARIESASAHAVLAGPEVPGTEGTDRLLLYEGLTMDVGMEEETMHAKLAAGLIAGGRIGADLTVGAGTSRLRPIQGRLEAQVPNLDPIAAMLPEVPGLTGALSAQVEVAGTMAVPRFTGQAEAIGLKAELPRLGLRLAEGRVRIGPGREGSLNITGGVVSGEGLVSLTGDWTPGGTSDLAIKGEKFLAADLPAARVVIAPDLRLRFDTAGMKLAGEVLVSRADVNLQHLPQGRVRGRSGDVVVIDRETKNKARAPLPLSADVVVDLGPESRVNGFGLESRVRGRLTVRESPGAPTSASGEVTVEGTYEGYGQDLRITRGRVLYAGTPIADPRLDIRAVRDIEEIEAGIHITGTAQRPEVNVFADPAMGQADALAYLVTGKPIARVGAGRETDLMDSAARSLGVAAGALVGERIGRQLGLDEVGIEKSDIIEGEVFTVGQYLSPRLYVAYGVGLFDAGDLVTLRYELSESIDLRAVRGPGETRAGIEYRIER